jgi:hypothetical protein
LKRISALALILIILGTLWINCSAAENEKYITQKLFSESNGEQLFTLVRINHKIRRRIHRNGAYAFYKEWMESSQTARAFAVVWNIS